MERILFVSSRDGDVNVHTLEIATVTAVPSTTKFIVLQADKTVGDISDGE
jgi:hypothetical protein